MSPDLVNQLGSSLVPDPRNGRIVLRFPRMEWIRKKLPYGPDLIVFSAAFTVAYLLRFDFDIPNNERAHWLVQLPFVLLIQFASLRFFGVYRLIWRYIGMSELNSFLKAACLALAPILCFRLLLPESLHQFRVPLSVILINIGLAYGGVLGLRVLRRALYETYERSGNSTRLRRKNRKWKSPDGKSVLLIGAGRTGMLAAREIQSRGDLNLKIKGFVDDDPHKLRSIVQGVEVLGTSTNLPKLVRELEIDHVVITVAHASRREIQKLVKICERIPVRARIVPGLHEIVQGRVEVNPVRDLQIEDVLGREPVKLDEQDMKRFLVDKRVMVTGAGGSIGSELCRQILLFQPSSLLLVERAEFSLFHIDQELRQQWPDRSIVPLVADISDEARMRSIFSTYRPEVVFHSAAHKHVPMMESNISEVVKNNILGTHLLGELAGHFGVQVLILISTDKAVRPTSVMGASKRMAELIVQNLNQQFNTRYAAVRFGNVIGSAGSVIPIFQEQIRRGGPVTVTHPDMVRYFMTIPEAAQLVMQAGAMAQGGEVFVLDMGEPVHILGLAKDLIRLAGLQPFEDIDIVFTGMRPGEKLFEELQTTEEYLTKTRHPKIFIGKIASLPEEKVSKALGIFSTLSEQGQDQELRSFLSDMLPEAQLEPGSSGNGDSKNIFEHVLVPTISKESPRGLSLTLEPGSLSPACASE